MGTCLSDHDLAAFVDGSGTPEQLAAWDEHVGACHSCAAHLAKKVRSRTAPPSATPTSRSVPGPTDEQATVTFKPPGKPQIDAGGALPPSDSIPGYKILKELHRGGQGVVYLTVA